MLDLTPLLGAYDYTLGTVDVAYITRGVILVVFIWIVGIAFLNLLKGLMK